jgi:hypothetical protein
MAAAGDADKQKSEQVTQQPASAKDLSIAHARDVSVLSGWIGKAVGSVLTPRSHGSSSYANGFPVAVKSLAPANGLRMRMWWPKAYTETIDLGLMSRAFGETWNTVRNEVSPTLRIDSIQFCWEAEGSADHSCVIVEVAHIGAKLTGKRPSAALVPGLGWEQRMSVFLNLCDRLAEAQEGVLLGSTTAESAQPGGLVFEKAAGAEDKKPRVDTVAGKCEDESDDDEKDNDTIVQCAFDADEMAKEIRCVCEEGLGMKDPSLVTTRAMNASAGRAVAALHALLVQEAGSASDEWDSGITIGTRKSPPAFFASTSQLPLGFDVSLHFGIVSAAGLGARDRFVASIRERKVSVWTEMLQ